MIKGKRVLTTGDVAKICNVAARTVSKWFDNGQLKGYRIPGSKDRRIPLAELTRFMKANNFPPADFAFGTMRVLIADSDAQNAQQLAKNLKKKEDYEIQIAQSNFEIGSQIHKFVPNIILINIKADKIDTANICKEISETEELQSIKVVAIAPNATDAKEKQLLQKGFNSVIKDLDNIDEVAKIIEQTVSALY